MVFCMRGIPLFGDEGSMRLSLIAEERTDRHAKSKSTDVALIQTYASRSIPCFARPRSVLSFSATGKRSHLAGTIASLATNTIQSAIHASIRKASVRCRLLREGLLERPDKGKVLQYRRARYGRYEDAFVIRKTGETAEYSCEEENNPKATVTTCYTEMAVEHLPTKFKHEDGGEAETFDVGDRGEVKTYEDVALSGKTVWACLETRSGKRPSQCKTNLVMPDCNIWLNAIKHANKIVEHEVIFRAKVRDKTSKEYIRKLVKYAGMRGIEVNEIYEGNIVVLYSEIMSVPYVNDRDARLRSADGVVRTINGVRKMKNIAEVTSVQEKIIEASDHILTTIIQIEGEEYTSVFGIQTFHSENSWTYVSLVIDVTEYGAVPVTFEDRRTLLPVVGGDFWVLVDSEMTSDESKVYRMFPRYSGLLMESGLRKTGEVVPTMLEQNEKFDYDKKVEISGKNLMIRRVYKNELFKYELVAIENRRGGEHNNEDILIARMAKPLAVDERDPMLREFIWEDYLKIFDAASLVYTVLILVTLINVKITLSATIVLAVEAVVEVLNRGLIARKLATQHGCIGALINSVSPIHWSMVDDESTSVEPWMRRMPIRMEAMSGTISMVVAIANAVEDRSGGNLIMSLIGSVIGIANAANKSLVSDWTCDVTTANLPTIMLGYLLQHVFGIMYQMFVLGSNTNILTAIAAVCGVIEGTAAAISMFKLSSKGKNGVECEAVTNKLVRGALKMVEEMEHLKILVIDSRTHKLKAISMEKLRVDRSIGITVAKIEGKIYALHSQHKKFTYNTLVKELGIGASSGSSLTSKCSAEEAERCGYDICAIRCDEGICPIMAHMNENSTIFSLHARTGNGNGIKVTVRPFPPIVRRARRHTINANACST